MKSIPFFFCLLLCTLGVQAQIFVNANATGQNNGSSWSNALTSLETALAIAIPGESVWVAKGVYKPDSSTVDKKFVLKSGVDLYGGFAGTETALDQRDIAANETTLSGDMQGNDVPNNFTVNRSDNLLHILICQSVNNMWSTVDGISFKNGHAIPGTSDLDPNTRSAAIEVTYNMHIKNCYFTQNHARLGGCISVGYIGGDSLNIEDCTFERNQASRLGAGLIIIGSPGINIQRCTMKNNSAVAGGGLFIQNVYAGVVTINECTFTANTCPTGDGGAISSRGSKINLTNSSLTDNISRLGGCIYTNPTIFGEQFDISNCEFKNNTAVTGGYGGAIMGASGPHMNLFKVTFDGNKAPTGGAIFMNNYFVYDYGDVNIDSCNFYNNSANSTLNTGGGGGGMYVGHLKYTISNSKFIANKGTFGAGGLDSCDSTLFTITNTLFSNNTSKNDGGFTFCYDSKGTVTNCVFEANKATVGNGGAGSCIFDSEATFDHCIFRKNIGKQSAGTLAYACKKAVFLSCLFEENESGSFAGSIAAEGNPDAEITIDDCSFLSNKAATQGGVLLFGECKNVNVSNSIFQNNYGKVRSGCLYTIDSDVRMTNCLMTKNYTGSTGYGGTICNFTHTNSSAHLTLINCTLADNESPHGSGINQWNEGTGSTNLILQNCILQQNGGNYLIEAGTPQVFTNGGNQVSDSTLAAVLIGEKDEHQLSSTFVNTNLNDYHLQDGPGVDGGVLDGAPLEDLEANPRIGAPDRGCYEFGLSSTQTIGFKMRPMKINPNPVIDQATITLENNKTGPAEIIILDNNGRLVQTIETEKTDNQFTQTIRVANLEAGTYRVRVRVGATVHEGLLVKVR